MPLKLSKAVPQSYNSVFLSLLLLNTAGIFVLFLKSDLDIRQVGNEISIIRRQIEEQSLSETALAKYQQYAERSAIRDEKGGRILAHADDYSFVLRGIGVCDGVYSIGMPEAPFGKTLEEYKIYALTHPMSPTESDLGQVVIERDLFPAEQKTVPHAMSTLSFRESGMIVSHKTVKVPDCELTVTAR